MLTRYMINIPIKFMQKIMHAQVFSMLEAEIKIY